MTDVDRAYRSQRQRLRAALLAIVAREWLAASMQAQDAFAAAVAPVVAAGQAQTARLVDAYMATKTLQATGRGQVRGLNTEKYTTAELRGVPAAEVYLRPFGAVGAALQKGAEFSVAKAAGKAAVDKLVTTDVQLAQTYSARDWMTDEDSITGYERITDGGCELCSAASTRTYRSEDLMPIHEHCQCDVSPVYGPRPGRALGSGWSVTREHAEESLSEETLTRLSDGGMKLPETLTVARDPELGFRLVDDAWQVAA